MAEKDEACLLDLLPIPITEILFEMVLSMERCVYSRKLTSAFHRQLAGELSQFVSNRTRRKTKQRQIKLSSGMSDKIIECTNTTLITAPMHATFRAHHGSVLKLSGGNLGNIELACCLKENTNLTNEELKRMVMQVAEMPYTYRGDEIKRTSGVLHIHLFFEDHDIHWKYVSTQD